VGAAGIAALARGVGLARATAGAALAKLFGGSSSCSASNAPAAGQGANQLADRLIQQSNGSVSRALDALNKLQVGQGRAIDVLQRMYQQTGRGTGPVQDLGNGSVALLSRRIGSDQSILVISAEGIVRTATATIEVVGTSVRATNIQY